MSGRLIGVGTGPGDPELITLKAVKALAQADVVAHFAKRGRMSNARTIVARYIQPDVVELPLLYPVTTEIPKEDLAYQRAIEAFYEESARTVAAHLEAGRTVAVLSEGDPLFFGSYMHLHVRLAGRYPTEVIAGITAMSGCWSAVGLPIAQGDDVLSVLPGTLPEAELASRLAGVDAAIIMKVGRNLPKIRRALDAAGKLDEAVFVERGTMEAMRTMRLADKPDDKAAYFSIVLVPGWQGRGVDTGQSHLAAPPPTPSRPVAGPPLPRDGGEEAPAAMKGALPLPHKKWGRGGSGQSPETEWGSLAEESPQAKAIHPDGPDAEAPRESTAPARSRVRP